MFCSQCGTELAANAKFCAGCGTSLAGSSTAPKASSTAAATSESKRGFLSKLSSGDYGLAKTFWIYGVTVSVLFGITERVMSYTMLGVDQSSKFIAIFVLMYTAFQLFVTVGTWNSAKRYMGAKIWSVLAMVTCMLSFFGLASNIISRWQRYMPDTSSGWARALLVGLSFIAHGIKFYETRYLGVFLRLCCDRRAGRKIWCKGHRRPGLPLAL